MDANTIKLAAEYAAGIEAAEKALAVLEDYCGTRYAPLTGGLEVCVPAGQNADGTRRPPNEDQTVHPGRFTAEESDKVLAFIKTEIWQKRIDYLNAQIAAL